MKAYDSEKHAVGLGAGSTTLKGFMVAPGSYRKSVQPRRGPIQIAEETYIQDGRLSEWSQSSWSGGAYQGVFQDPAQFAACLGMLPGARNPEHLRTCQNLEMLVDDAGDPVNTANYQALDTARDYFVAWGALYILCDFNILHKFEPTVAGTVTATTFTLARPHSASASPTCIAPMRGPGLLLAGYDDGSVCEWDLKEDSPDIREVVKELYGEHLPVELPDPHGEVTAIINYAGSVVVAWENWLFYYAETDEAPQADIAWDWVKLGSVQEDYVQQFEIHRSELYMLSRTWPASTAVDMTTLVAGILPWMQIPYMFYGQMLKSYAGRLYIGGAAYDADGTARYGQLFEATGNELRDLRVYYEDPERLEGTNHLTQIKGGAVFEGKLLYPHYERKAVEIYDFLTDGFFTAWPMGASYDAQPLEIMSQGAECYVLCGGTDDGLYHIPRDSTTDITPWVELSELIVQPGVDKIWGEVIVRTGLTDTECTASTDGGLNWSADLPRTVEQDGYGFVTRFSLAALDPSDTLKLRVFMKLTDHFTESEYYQRELESVTVSFLLRPPRIRQYDMGLVLAERLELLDGSVDTGFDPEGAISELWSLYDAGAPVVFTDRNGEQVTCVLTYIQESEPSIWDGTDREAYISIGLAELER